MGSLLSGHGDLVGGMMSPRSRRFLRRLPPLLCVAFLLGCSGSGTGVLEPLDEEGNYRGTLKSDGVTRSYLLHVPSGESSEGPLPLLVVFHGAPGSGSQVRSITGMDHLADQFGFVVAYPDAYHLEWAVGCRCTRAELDGVSDVRLVRNLIQSLERRVGIDRGRVFVAGYSQGALMTHRLGCELSDRLAGAASVAATMLAGVAQDCTPPHPLPILFFHGSDDQVFPREGRVEPSATSLSMEATLATWVELNDCDAQPEVVALPDPVEDGTAVFRWSYWGCRPGGALTYFAIEGGGHTWPGSQVPTGSGPVSRDISASDIIARFVAQGAPG